jgi:hypothetical protein
MPDSLTPVSPQTGTVPFLPRNCITRRPPGVRTTFVLLDAVLYDLRRRNMSRWTISVSVGKNGNAQADRRIGEPLLGTRRVATIPKHDVVLGKLPSKRNKT